METITFIRATFYFDIGGKEYKVVVKMDKSVRIYDSFSGDILLEASVEDVYSDDEIIGLTEAELLCYTIDVLLK